ncbi:hypothetical protein M0813_21992 [Anaeramoeba flamelloides]|uniref:VASt domain-containing protein n=1 Tax=Anaeramoeba flamelloides TaxID=1746091 RepID=A0ABQ8YG40_9EUKA|nr:hypothetical protein M0813_21992 [Anaeramoeba flamelloides]
MEHTRELKKKFDCSTVEFFNQYFSYGFTLNFLKECENEEISITQWDLDKERIITYKNKSFSSTIFQAFNAKNITQEKQSYSVEDETNYIVQSNFQIKGTNEESFLIQTTYKILPIANSSCEVKITAEITCNKLDLKNTYETILKDKWEEILESWLFYSYNDLKLKMSQGTINTPNKPSNFRKKNRNSSKINTPNMNTHNLKTPKTSNYGFLGGNFTSETPSEFYDFSSPDSNDFSDFSYSPQSNSMLPNFFEAGDTIMKTRVKQTPIRSRLQNETTIKKNKINRKLDLENKNQNQNQNKNQNSKQFYNFPNKSRRQNIKFMMSSLGSEQSPISNELSGYLKENEKEKQKSNLNNTILFTEENENEQLQFNELSENLEDVEKQFNEKDKEANKLLDKEFESALEEKIQSILKSQKKIENVLTKLKENNIEINLPNEGSTGLQIKKALTSFFKYSLVSGVSIFATYATISILNDEELKNYSFWNKAIKKVSNLIPKKNQNKK